MMKWLYVFVVLLIYACRETPYELSQHEIELSKVYDVVCEKWIEQNFACKTDSCFSSAAVEIVGIDTSDADLYQIYTWFWNEHFIVKDGITYSGNYKLSIARFSIQPSTVSKKIDQVYIPNDTLPLKEQLEAENFPKQIIHTFFLDQHSNIERIRIQALSNKSKKKYELFQRNLYQIPEIIEDDTLM
ncbi:MAG: hypothetical protein M9887_04645 [Chitinophagales bacterium]|nr:hypothetical protein [Chitinophagales bacterium]